jgi:hypothetical protein
MLIFLTAPLPTLSSIFRSRAALELENLALRHQIGVLQRSARKRPTLTSWDRLLWICLSRLRDWRSALAIVKPETVVAWHRASFSPVLDLEGAARPTRTTRHLHGTVRTVRPREFLYFLNGRWAHNEYRLRFRRPNSRQKPLSAPAGGSARSGKLAPRLRSSIFTRETSPQQNDTGATGSED